MASGGPRALRRGPCQAAGGARRRSPDAMRTCATCPGSEAAPACGAPPVMPHRRVTAASRRLRTSRLGAASRDPGGRGGIGRDRAAPAGKWRSARSPSGRRAKASPPAPWPPPLGPIARPGAPPGTRTRRLHTQNPRARRGRTGRRHAQGAGAPPRADADLRPQPAAADRQANGGDPACPGRSLPFRKSAGHRRSRPAANRPDGAGRGHGARGIRPGAAPCVQPILLENAKCGREGTRSWNLVPKLG